MAQEPSNDLTQLLIDWSEGDSQALDRLMPLVYNELHRQAERQMARERHDHTLQPTALVHETFLKLIDQNRISWQNRAQFYGVSAQLMRRIVLKHARRHNAEKRGGQSIKIPLAESEAIAVSRAPDLIVLDEALDRLATFDPRQSRLVELRYFGGLTVEEAAACLSISTATVKREMRLARAWLQNELSGEDRSEPDDAS